MEVLRGRGLDPTAIVVSENGTGDEPPLSETLDDLARLTPGAPLIALPRLGADAAVGRPAIGRVLDFLSLERPER